VRTRFDPRQRVIDIAQTRLLPLVEPLEDARVAFFLRVLLDLRFTPSLISAKLRSRGVGVLAALSADVCDLPYAGSRHGESPKSQSSFRFGFRSPETGKQRQNSRDMRTQSQGQLK